MVTRSLILFAGALSAVAATAALAGARSVVPNPANDSSLLGKPIEDFRYDRATACERGVPAGMKALEGWLERNVRGQSWGVTRCERLKSGASTAARLGYASQNKNFSVHSEGRAIDWHLDAGVPRERRAAMRLIRTLLAPDREGNEAALARRMGVQGLIFDCKSWWSSPGGLGAYSYCFKGNGELRNGLDRTQAHRDHIHIELNWPGARKQTSFWHSKAARR